MIILADLKPLLDLLSQQNEIPQLVASGVQRCAIMISGDNYALKDRTAVTISSVDCLFDF